MQNLKTLAVEEHVCDVLINATGILNSWKWPDVKGVGIFKGQMAHSAAWDPTIDLKDKMVALIGNGLAFPQQC